MKRPSLKKARKQKNTVKVVCLVSGKEEFLDELENSRSYKFEK